jgi:hypothetical protein
MKKLILMAAFAGLLGSTVVANTLGDDKDKKKKCAKGKTCCQKSKKCNKDKEKEAGTTAEMKAQ